MSLLPYSLARPFLFAMDAETAHEHTLAMLARTQTRRWLGPTAKSACKIRFNSRA